MVEYTGKLACGCTMAVTDLLDDVLDRSSSYHRNGDLARRVSCRVLSTPLEHLRFYRPGEFAQRSVRGAPNREQYPKR